MLGDLLTKCVDAAQKRNLGLRFYNDCIFPDGRFYKFHCFESDCIVRIATSADFIPRTNFPLLPVPSSPSWTRDNFPADSETVSKDPRWCSTTALRLQQRFLTTEWLIRYRINSTPGEYRGTPGPPIPYCPLYQCPRIGNRDQEFLPTGCPKCTVIIQYRYEYYAVRLPIIANRNESPPEWLLCLCQFP